MDTWQTIESEIKIPKYPLNWLFFCHKYEFRHLYKCSTTFKLNQFIRKQWLWCSKNGTIPIHPGKEKARERNREKEKKSANTIECILCVFGLTLFANIWFNLKTQQACKDIFGKLFIKLFVFECFNWESNLEKWALNQQKNNGSILMQAKHLQL